MSEVDEKGEAIASIPSALPFELRLGQEQVQPPDSIAASDGTVGDVNCRPCKWLTMVCSRVQCAFSLPC